jgi:hypothetical protein
MTRLTVIKRRSLHLIFEAIVRFWIRPIEAWLLPRLSQNSPSRFQRLLFWLASGCANVGRVAVLDVRLTVTRLTGPDWSVTYIGEGPSAEALGYALFPAPPEVNELPRAFLWQLPALISKSAKEGDLVVCELNEIIAIPPANSDVVFSTAAWIQQTLEDIDRPLDEILAAMNQTMRRHIRQLETQDFSYEFTQAQDDFDLFYHNMYLPYITARHSGKGGLINDYETLERIFRLGGLILVKQGQTAVCGMLCFRQKDTWRACEMGVLKGNFDVVKKGSNVALWWFMLDWARRQKARRFDFGSSRAQTANGPFKFKRQWGTRVYSRGHYTPWTFLGREVPAQLREHINAQGFITEVDGRCYRVLLLNPAETPEAVDLSGHLREAASCGLAGIVAFFGERRLSVIPCQKVEPA